MRAVEWSVLMASAQSGDRGAYRQLLLAVTPMIRGRVARAFRDPAENEDVVQEVLMTLHAIRHTYDPGRPFGPWLVAIIQRRVVDRLRRKGRELEREAPWDDADVTFADPATNQQESAVDALRLREAINKLPAGQRDALRMLKLEDMSLKEAAAASGTSVAALKVATHRALQSLRRMLRDR